MAKYNFSLNVYDQNGWHTEEFVGTGYDLQDGVLLIHSVPTTHLAGQRLGPNDTTWIFGPGTWGKLTITDGHES